MPNCLLKFLLFIAFVLSNLSGYSQEKADLQQLEKSFQKRKFEDFEKQASELYLNSKAIPEKTLLQWAYISEEQMNYPLAVYLLMFVNKHVQDRDLKEKVKEIVENRSLNIPGETLILQEFSFQDYAIKYLRFVNISLVSLCFLLLVQMVNNTRKGKSFSYRPIILSVFVSLLLSFNNLLKPTIFALVSTENCLGYSEVTSASTVVSKLDKGKIVEIIDTQREWTKVRISNKVFWVKSATLFNLFQTG